MKPQPSGNIRIFVQVTESAPRTLSRWRHGFKSRWDYQGNRRARSAVSTLVKVQTGLRITAGAQVVGTQLAEPKVVVPHLSRGGQPDVTT